jgi:hypothetical protein
VSILGVTGHQAIPDKPIIDNYSVFAAARRFVREYLLIWAAALE